MTQYHLNQIKHPIRSYINWKYFSLCNFSLGKYGIIWHCNSNNITSNDITYEVSWIFLTSNIKIIKRRIRNPVKHLKWSFLWKHFSLRKKLHLRCLTEFWIRLWSTPNFLKKIILSLSIWLSVHDVLTTVSDGDGCMCKCCICAHSLHDHQPL